MECRQIFNLGKFGGEVPLKGHTLALALAARKMSTWNQALHFRYFGACSQNTLQMF